MPQILLEIGTEEMPARFLGGLADELQRLLGGALIEAKIDFARIFSHATPRRIVAHVTGAADTQRSEQEIVTGPPARIAFDASGNPTKAGLGFAKSQGVDMAEVYVTTTDKGEYLAVTKATGGAPTLEVLPAICEAAVRGLAFPKKMRWGDRDFAFGRPVRWLLALCDAEVVPFALDDLASGRETRGHRVMGPGPFAVADPDDYFRVLREKAFVVLDAAERKAMIVHEGERLAAELGGTVIPNERLLEQVAGLVEYPRPMLGSFDERYLELPREVLLTSMETHQKSFGISADASGRLLPRFLTVCNIEPTDISLVRKGWERVLKARLEDARFFWEHDNQSGFDAWLASLESVTFLAPLGSMADKSRRLIGLCSWLAETVQPELLLDLSEAGRIAKADLVTGMVGEFDELQGNMGGIYARRKGFPENVARAVYEHYLPAGPDSPVPQSLPGALLAVADKADTLAGTFGLNMIPTGGADPYALRRAALGICRILLEHGLSVPLSALVDRAFAGYANVAWKLEPTVAREKLLDFFAQRLKAYFTAREYSTLVVEACLGAGFDDLVAFRGRLDALAAFSAQPDFERAVLTFKRAANIIRKQGAEAGRELTGNFDAGLFEHEAERVLAESVAATLPRFEAHWQAGEYGALMALLGELRPVVDAFFDNVMVMCEDEKLRANRLDLLQALVSMLSRLADFNALQV